MDTALGLVESFAMLEPGLPLRLEVEAAIYFGPLNQRTYHMVLPRIELGLKISAYYDGYWRKNKDGRIQRFASLQEKDSIVILDHSYISVFIDLQEMPFNEVIELYQLLIQSQKGGNSYMLW